MYVHVHIYVCMHVCTYVCMYVCIMLMYISHYIQASEDARRQMGNRKYFDQMLYDACQHNQLQVTDVIDITTVKDYMKV